MPTIPNKKNFIRTFPNEGTHIARVVGFIYMGTIEDEYMGEKKINQKIRLTWELPDELHVFKEGEDAKPLVHSEEYNLSMGNKSKLRPIVEGIIGTTLTDEEAYSFDVEKLINLPCLVSLKKMKTKKGVDYMKLAGTSKLMKGQVVKEAFNAPTILNYSDHWDEEKFNKLPEFIKEKMKSSDEYKTMKGIISDEVVDDLLPF